MILSQPYLRTLFINGVWYPIPYGFPHRTSDFVQRKNNKLWIMRSKEIIELHKHTIVVPESRAILHPYFNQAVKLKNSQMLTIEPVLTANELSECGKLPHYLSWPSGLYVCGKIDGRVVGALVLSRLVYHMRPVWRRELELKLGKYIEALWVRRISVAEKYQRLGIGGQLAKAAISIGAKYWVPRPRIVELISRYGEHGFLTRNGYVRAEGGRKGNLRIVLPNGATIKKLETRYYYWASVPSHEKTRKIIPTVEG